MTLMVSGNYHYRCNDELMPITEPWQLSRTSDGLVLRGQRLRGVETLMDVEAEYSGTNCMRLRLVWNHGGRRVFTYRHQGDTLKWNEEDHSPQVFDLPSGCLIFPLLRAASGMIISQLAEKPGWLVMPSLVDESDREKFLTPLLSERRTELTGQEATEGRHYRYYGGEYGEAGSDYWLDPHDLVRRYCWNSPQGNWDIRLEDYWAAENFDGFK